MTCVGADTFYMKRMENQVISLFEETRDMFQSGEIIWCLVGAFFPNVLYLSPVLNTYLQELSEKVYKELLKIARDNLPELYRLKYRIFGKHLL